MKARRLAARVLKLSIALFVIACAVLYLGRDAILHEALQRALTDDGATQIAKAEWSGWLRVRLEGIEHASSGVQARCATAEVVIDYDRTQGVHLQSVAVRQATVKLLPEQLPAREKSETTSLPELPQGLPRIELDQLQLEVAFEDGRNATLTDGHVVLANQQLSVQAANVRFRGPGFDLQAPLVAEIQQVQRGIDITKWSWDPRVQVRRAHVDWNAGHYQYALDAQLLDGDVQLNGSLHTTDESPRLDGNLRVRGINVGTASAWFGQTGLSGTLDGDWSFTTPLDADSVALQAQLSGFIALHNGLVHSVPLDMRGRVEYQQGVVTLRETTVISGPNMAQVAIAQVALLDLDTCRVLDTSVVLARVELHELGLTFEDERAATRAGLHAHVRLIDGVLRLDGTSLASEDGVASIEHLQVDVAQLNLTEPDNTAGPLQWIQRLGRDPVTQLSARFDFHDLGDTLRFFHLSPPESDEDFLGRAQGTLAWRGALTGPTMQVEVDIKGAQALDVRIDDLHVRGELSDGDERRVDLELRARTSVGDIEGAGSYDFPSQALQVRAQLALVDLERLPFPLPLDGDARAELNLSGPIDDLRGRVVLAAERLVIQGTELKQVRLDAERTAEDWVVRESTATWQDTRVRVTGEGTLLADGSVRALLQTAEIQHQELQGTLTEPSMVTLQADGLLRSTMSWSTSHGTVQLTADLNARTLVGGLSAEVDLHDLQRLAALQLADAQPVATLEDLSYRGRLAVELDQDLRALRLNGNGHLLDSRLPSVLTYRGSAQWTPAQVQLHMEELALGTALQSSLQLTLPLQAGSLASAGETEVRLQLSIPAVEALPLPVKGGALSGALDILIELRGQPTQLLGRAQAGLRNWRFAASENGVALGPFHAQLDLTATEQQVTLRAAQASLEGLTRTTLEGYFGRGLNLQRLVADPQAILTAPLHLQVGGELGDLSPLAAQVQALRRLSGRLRGSVQLNGTLGEPRLTGEVQLENGELRLSTDVPSLQNVQARIQFDEQRAWLTDTRGELGGAPFALTGELRWDAGTPLLNLSLTGSELLLLRSRYLTVRADTDLRLSGPLDTLTMGGSIRLVDGRYSKPIDPLAFALRPRSYRGDGKNGLFRLEDPLFANVRFDVELGAKTAFRVENELLRLRFLPALKLTGTGALPVLVGDVRIEPSRIFLPASVLTLDGGALRFRPSKPDQMELEFTGRSRVLGYDTTLLGSGTLDDPVLDLSSSPPASREDLVLLLLTGRPPGGSAFGSGERAARGVALYVARDLFSDGPDDTESVMERLEVVSGARTSRRGVDTIELRLRIGGEDGTDALYLAADRDVYEDWNYGLRFVWRPK